MSGLIELLNTFAWSIITWASNLLTWEFWQIAVAVVAVWVIGWAMNKILLKRG